MDKSIFTDKNDIPTDKALAGKLAGAHVLWKELVAYVKNKMPAAVEEWNFSGGLYGWSFRIKDKKRAIIYLLPRDRFFKISMVFGQKATDQVMESKISQSIKDELMAARVYAEGRGIRIEAGKKILPDIKVLIDIKMSN